MRLKKMLIVIISVVTFCVVTFLQNGVYAGATVYFRITELMSDGMGYGIGNPYASGTTAVGAKIWNLVQYPSETSTSPMSTTAFCVKAGVGFSDARKSEEYNVSYDMKTQMEDIEKQNDVLASIVEGQVIYNSKSANKYHAILSMLDLFYVKGESSPEEKDALLKAAKVYVADDWTEEWDFILTEDDVKAVEQAALWYLTNYGDPLYDKTSKTGWLNYTLNGTDYTSLSDYNLSTSEGEQRQQQAEILYRYLISTAIQNASKYASSTGGNVPATVNTENLNYTSSGENYIVGPINITENGSSTPYTIDFLVKNGEANVTSYTLLDKNKVTTSKTVKELVGNDFYISVPKDSVTIANLTIGININYSDTQLTLYASDKNNSAQPLVVPKKGSVSIPLTLTIPERKFDLSLRKYITKVNGVELKEGESRVPVIDETTLKTGTTATYKHRKDPVPVKKGNIVTYKMTIYNEGEREGRATKIIDQLPAGLKFKQIISGNFKLGTYSESDNTLTLLRKDGNNVNLNAYSTGHLSSETIEIECEVIEIASELNDKILTNVAWIAEEVDSEGGVVITNQEGADRDSEPHTKPDVNKDNMSDYKGNGNKDDLSDSNYYYKGWQDDDDFEKLILPKREFDLSLRKFIIASSEDTTIEDKEYLTNEDGTYKRAPIVDTSKLNTLDEDGNKITTAIYNHTKEPLVVKRNDIVVYMIRVYNEGEEDGYASEIKDHLPPYLEYVNGEFNKKYGWEVTEDGRTVTTRYLEDSKITKAMKNTDGKIVLDYKEVPIMCKVKETAPKDMKITNIADITEYKDEDKNLVKDRDSESNNVKLPENKDLPSYKDDEEGDYIPGQEDDDDFEKVIIPMGEFDLSLRKFIIASSEDTTIEDKEYLKNEDGTYKRAPIVDTSKLNTLDKDGNKITTAIYNHTKEPLVVKKNEIVVYMIRVYNEGQEDGYASEIKDHLPPYLEYVDGEFNKKYGWEVTEDGRTVTTRYLEDSKITKAMKNTEGKIVLDYKEVPIMCKVKEIAKTDEKITNIADITEYKDEDKNPAKDRDSESNNVKLPEDKDLPSYKDDEEGDYIPGQEDDDDFEKVIIPEEIKEPEKEFDLSLRKFIIAVSADEKIEENEYLKNKDGSYKRAPIVDTSKLNTLDKDGNKITTAIYKHTKEAVKVNKNDIVIYMIRVYNEGEIDGYASEIKDHLPPYLEYVNGEFNKKYKWEVTEDGRTVTTRYLEDSKITKATKNAEGKIVLDYKEVPIMCKVKEIAKTNEKITNIADITEYKDGDKNPVKDRDSESNNVKLPEDKDLPSYKDDEEGDYIPGQEDDDDFEKVIIPEEIKEPEKEFDLSLRKFIIAVSADEKIEENEYLKNKDGSYKRAPIVDTSKLNTLDKDGNKITTAIYKHTKEAVKVNKNDIVIYMIRVYNEGEIDGYASEIKDHLPPYLEYVNGEFNKKYGWEIAEDGRTVTTRYLEDSKITKATKNAEGKIVLDYKEVPIMCKVKEIAKTNEKITNIADITEYKDEDKNPAKDRDSESNNVKLPKDKELPSYKDNEKQNYIPGQEDDDDFEKVIIPEEKKEPKKVFDLSLRKWVTQAIVIEDGKQTITNTGHKPYDNPEQIVKVELHRKKLNKVTVKFRYSIRVLNEGNVEGYAKEVKDYIPQGLKFIAADNPGWKDEGNNVISTKLLENKLLKPGEYADVEVLLTWINSGENIGLKVNTAEISKDYNEYGLPDKDSTPDNKKQGEDDIDDAPVMLSVSTGQIRIYFTIGFVILVIIGSGIVLIKRYVMR